MTLNPIYKIIIEGKMLQGYDSTSSIQKEIEIDASFILKNVTSIYMEEDLNMFTDVATVILPLDKFVLTGIGLTYLLDHSKYLIKSDGSTKINIYMGYSNTTFKSLPGQYNLIQVYNGYIKDIYVNNSQIELSCENEMFMLKKSDSIKRSYPSPIQSGIIDDLLAELFVGEEFKLHHFLYNLFAYGKNDTGERNYPYSIYCYPDFTLGKLRLNDFFKISEILSQLKDKYGVYVYFRLKPYDYYYNEVVQIPDLYIGYKYWNSTISYDVTEIIQKQGVILEKDAPFWNKRHLFSYPYTEGYNRIIENNLDWVNTDKENLIVTFQSINTRTSEVLTYVYPEDKPQYNAEVLKRKLNDSNKNDIKVVNKAKEKIKEKNIEDYVVFSENNANKVNINIPNMDLKSMKLAAKKKYDEYQDSGYEGSFITFGEPYVQKGDIVQLKLEKKSPTEVSNGVEIYSYYVDKVVRTFDSSNGYRQEIFIGSRYFDQSYNSL